MTTYDIYGYENASEDASVVVTVTLSDDDSKIVSVAGRDSETQEEAESVLNDYVSLGMSPTDAIARYAGSYGDVKRADSGDSLTAAMVEETGTDTTEFTIPDGIMAMADDNGTVVTLLKRDPEQGAVYRHDGAWHPVVDPTVFDGLTFVGVTASSEAVYDKYEADDKLVTVGHYYPSAEGPYWPDPVKVYDEPETAEESAANRDDDDEDVLDDSDLAESVASDDETAVTASVVVDSAEDLDIAIAAAIVNPEIRWYVERRVASLGLEVALPWLKD